MVTYMMTYETKVYMTLKYVRTSPASLSADTDRLKFEDFWKSLHQDMFQYTVYIDDNHPNIHFRNYLFHFTADFRNTHAAFFYFFSATFLYYQILWKLFLFYIFTWQWGTYTVPVPFASVTFSRLFIARTETIKKIRRIQLLRARPAVLSAKRYDNMGQ